MKLTHSYQTVADYLSGLKRFGLKPGLERIRALMERFENPHLKYPVVLVGGTNGKGSTVEFLASILRKAGNRVGVYTSPHLYRFNERIRVLAFPWTTAILGGGTGGRNPSPSGGAGGEGLFPGAISDDDLARLLELVRPVAEEIERTTELGGATTFELLTAMGFIYFAEQQVDIAVVEVGLGGRWDATNLTDPIVSVITNVSLDHTDRLGDTVEKIAREKVEIARPGRVLVTGETKPEVLRVFEETCAARGVELVCAPAEVEIKLDHGRRSFVTFRDRASPNVLVMRSALADYQRQNIACALEAALQLKREGLSIRRGMGLKTRLVGRFEWARKKGRPPVVLDGANNVAAMESLHGVFQDIIRVRHLRRGFCGVKHVLPVLGISADKAIDEMVAIIAPLARTLIATQAHNPRAAPAERIAETARRHCNDVRVAVPVMEAVRLALREAKHDDLVLITGSFFVLGEVDREELARLGSKTSE